MSPLCQLGVVPGDRCPVECEHFHTQVCISQETRRLIMQNQEQVTLYNRLGGIYNIATVVDDFIDRIMVDPRLNATPRVDEAYHRVAPAGFKYLVTEMVGW